MRSDPTRTDPARTGPIASDEEPLRVVVVDDQDIVRDGLVTVLSLLDGIDVVGSAGDGAAGLDLIGREQPDAVLMDLRMPVMDGVRATELVAEQHPEVAVLVLTTYHDDASIGRALRAGARGYLTKDASRDDIVAALRSVVRGQATFAPAVSARLVARLGEPEPASAPGSAEEPAAVSGLTPREREVLQLIGAGLNNAEISERLFVSNATVKTHINNLFAKLGLRDRAQAVRLANQLR